jgi:hypothetical protein
MADKFRKTKSNFATTLVTGIGTGTGDTITLNSTTGLPTDTEITLTFNRVTSGGVVNSTAVMERITGTISGATLTSYRRGVDGTTEQAHAGGVVVEYIPNAADMNDQIDGILVEHNQDGTHNTTKVVDLTTSQTLTNKTLTSPKINEDVAVTSTATEINLLDGLTSLTNGWIASPDTWVYASASTFTIAGVDRTTTYTKGTRLKWNEGATVKYGVVVGSAFSTNTTVTILVNTDYVITNTTLSAAAYSYAANPQGYPSFFNCACTFAGFSSNPTGIINYASILGRTVTWTHREKTAGTSNANNFTISLPVQAATITDMSWSDQIGYCEDNGAASTTKDHHGMGSGGTVTVLNKNGSSTGWTTSNGKRANFTFIYEI